MKRTKELQKTNSAHFSPHFPMNLFMPCLVHGCGCMSLTMYMCPHMSAPVESVHVFSIWQKFHMCMCIRCTVTKVMAAWPLALYQCRLWVATKSLGTKLASRPHKLHVIHMQNFIYESWYNYICKHSKLSFQINLASYICMTSLIMEIKSPKEK